MSLNIDLILAEKYRSIEIGDLLSMDSYLIFYQPEDSNVVLNDLTGMGITNVLGSIKSESDVDEASSLSSDNSLIDLTAVEVYITEKAQNADDGKSLFRKLSFRE